MASTKLRELQTIEGRFANLPDHFYNTDLVSIEGGGLLLMMEKYAQNARAHTRSRLVSFDGKEWTLIKDFKGPRFYKDCLTVLQDHSILATSTEGEIFHVSNGKAKTVELGGKDVGKVFCIDGHTYAADGKAYHEGNRHIWKRNSSEDWETIFTSNSIVLTMTGFSENDLYISGLDVETWHFSDGAWAPINLPWQAASSRRSAPTINSSTISPNGDVFLAGRDCLFQGRGQEWRFIDLGEMAKKYNHIDQLTWFKNKLYFALRKDSGAVVSVGDDGIARPLLNNGKQVLATCITSDEQRIFICGSLGGVSSFDGSQWLSI